jgi:hypothetical protein
MWNSLHADLGNEIIRSAYFLRYFPEEDPLNREEDPLNRMVDVLLISAPLAPHKYLPRL